MKLPRMSSWWIPVLLATALPLAAHHAWPTDNSHLVTVKGTVVEVMWGNPHPMYTLDVATKDGRTERWQVGGPAINRMEAHGWSKTTLKRGDVITGTGYQLADGQKVIKLERVLLPDGKQMLVYATR